MQGKNAKKTFPSSESKAKGILEIDNSYVCGPVSYSSLRGYVYYVLFIDDFSHKTWIYLLKDQSEIFIKFKEYKSLDENMIDRKIKIIRSDNGGEVNSKEFKELCREYGIKRELSTPYNPQQNEIVERKNQTIMGAAKAMFLD